MKAKINYKKIALPALLVGVGIFLIKNLVAYLFFRENGLAIFSELGLLNMGLIIYTLVYYYVHAFILFAIFVYIRSVLPGEYIKAGLIFAFISFLFGNTIYSMMKLFVSDSIPSFVSNPALFYAVESLSSILSLLFAGLAVSYIFEKFYKK